MNKDFKPTGYNSVSPYFIIEGAQKFIDLMKAVFNTETLRRYDNADGTIMHAEIRIDDSIIMLGDASEKFPATSFWMLGGSWNSRSMFDTAERLLPTRRATSSCERWNSSMSCW